MKALADYFELKKYGTTIRTEAIAGLSTFMALSYIFVVNPAILAEGGFNKSAVLFATIACSFLATLAMGLWARKPFVVAPGMEMNSYVAYYAILGIGLTWQQALGAVFWSGVLCILFTALRIRENIIKAIPDRMKGALSLCVGVFLMLIALRLAGVIVYDGIWIKGPGAVLTPQAGVFAAGLALVLLLRRFRVPGAVLLSIAACSALAASLGLGNTGEPIKVSPEMLGALFKLDLGVILEPKAWAVILVLFLVDFYGSVAKFIGLTRSTNIVDAQGGLPKFKEALYVDGIATTAGAGFGTSSLITYVESGVGIAEGGRTGLTAVSCALLMLSFLFLAPLVNLVPVLATTGALFWVGFRMFPGREELRQFGLGDKLTVAVMIAVTVATFAIDKALLAGFATYALCAVAGRRAREVSAYMVLSMVLLAAGLCFSVVFK